MTTYANVCQRGSDRHKELLAGDYSRVMRYIPEAFYPTPDAVPKRADSVIAEVETLGPPDARFPGSQYMTIPFRVVRVVEGL